METTFVAAMTLGSLIIISIIVLLMVAVMMIPKKSRH